MSKWQDIKNQRLTTPESRERVEHGEEAIRAELRLAAIRHHRGVSQTTLADLLAVTQSNVSRIERSDDIRISTAIGYIAALGGRLELRAVFDDETLPVS